jgi:flagellin-like hook-associated protein FlgL
MSVVNVGARSAQSVRFLGTMRLQLEELQRQLGTGKRSPDYAGLGLNRGLTVSLRAQLSALSGYRETITHVGVRLDVAQSALTRIETIRGEVKSASLSTLFDLSSLGQTVNQTVAANGLDELFSLLNGRAGDRYLFSGRATDRPATALPDHILNGDGTRAGFKQVMAERLQADLGADGLGRLVTTPAGAVVSIAEDAAGSPFGFKLASIATTVSGAAVTAPAGSPQVESIDFTGSTPAEGETVTLRFTLPDGSSETLTLTATASATPGPNEFTIGATDADTATNFEATLDAALGTLAQTALRAASAMAASQDFFDVDETRPPQRVAGPPFDTATALIDGTAADTVTWYTGEAGTDDARGTAVARLDSNMSVAYGMRATEEGIRSVVQAVAVFAVTNFSQSDPNATAAYSAMRSRVTTVLSGPPNQQRVSDIMAELGGVQASAGAVKDRHNQMDVTLATLLEDVEGVNLEEVGVQILALQTNLQASLQTTALLYQTSLVNFI